MSAEGRHETTELYRHFDSDGRLLYVGVSLSTLRRLTQHRDKSAWFQSIQRVTVERFPSRAAAFEAERRAIATERPLHNVAGTAPRQRTVSKYESERAIVERLVSLRPIYKIVDVAALLDIGPSTVHRYIERGEMGYVELENTAGTPKKYVTGWQLIEFIEWLESKHAKATSGTA